MLEVRDCGSSRTRTTFDTGGDEVIVLPLAGSCTVTIDGERFDARRAARACSPRSPTSSTRRSARTWRSRARAASRFPPPPATRRLPARYGAAEDVPVELRGAGNASRQVNNFASVEAFECDKLIAVEVLTPNGNWSSYPPHRHDELEEIYYYEIAKRRVRLPARVRRDGAAGRGAQRRSDPHAARLPRPVDGRARLRPVLPQRDGRRASASGTSWTTPTTPGSATAGPTRRWTRDSR